MIWSHAKEINLQNHHAHKRLAYLVKQFTTIRGVALVLSVSLLLQIKMESRVIVCILFFTIMFVSSLKAMPMDNTPRYFDEGKQI